MSIRYKQKLIIGFTLLIVAIIVTSGAIVNYVASLEIEDEEPEEIIDEIDDRISPLVNQAVIIEILRIRHRGIIDKMMKIGLSWRTPPSFYFVTNIDEFEYISKDVRSRTGNTETLFNTWDSMFMENKINQNAEEEQKTSDLTLSIMERKKSGLFGFRSEDVEAETIHLTYDYKTGRWDGDDSYNDTDGYGHYVGDTFEVWFNVYQTDYDGDGIPYWTEVNILKTDPEFDDSKSDPDQDGIPTVWEWRWGYNPHVYDNHTILDPDQDGLENVEEYMMERWFSNPFSQDIYIEADGMKKGGLLDPEHVFWKESQQIMIERFCQHGINVYIDDGWPGGSSIGGGELLTHYKKLSQDSGMMLQFYRNHFAEERKGVFRYLVVGHAGGFCHPSEFNRYDTMILGTGSQTLLVTKCFTPRTRRLALAAAVMHELGHSLGIGPWNVGGNDNYSYAESNAAEQEYLEKWGDYRSVMNYYCIYDKNLVDYSDGTHGPNDVNDWELFDLTLFQKEGKVVEDPNFELPGEEEI